LVVHTPHSFFVLESPSLQPGVTLVQRFVPEQVACVSVVEIELVVKSQQYCGIQDSLIIGDYIEKLAATKTADAYCFLFICCCQFYNIKHVTPFQTFVEILRKYGRPYVALNKYYLKSSIPINLSSEEFANQVISECYKNLPECYYINQ
jgi:hypothetical protein